MAVNGYDPEQVVAAEQPHLQAGAPLMRRASHRLGVHAAQLLQDHTGMVYGRRAVLLVGSGSNGGDALFAGAYLRSRGVSVTAVLLGSRAHAEGLAALRAAHGRVLDPQGILGTQPPSGSGSSETEMDLALSTALEADLVVDGLLGTWASGALRQPASACVQALADGRAAQGRTEPGRKPLVLACDLPSGLDPRTGQVHGPVLPADRTVAFIGATSGVLAGPAEVVGEVCVEGLGIEQSLAAPDLIRLEDGDFASTWLVPGLADHKYTRGVLGTVVGSDQYPGAGLMAVRAAVNAGAGMVRFLGGESLAQAMALAVPEAVRSPAVGEGRVQAWAIGSGASGPWAEQQMQAALDSGQPVVADAAAIRLVAGRVAESGPVAEHVLMTPHAGELAEALEWVIRLDPQAAQQLRASALDAGLAPEQFPDSGHPSRDQIEEAPLVWATAGQAVLGGTLLLKGSITVVIGGSPEQQVRYVHQGSSPWLATAGSGDTLSGILGAAVAGTAAAQEEQEGAPVPGLWARTAATALLLQRRASALQPGPVPPTVAASRLPQALGQLLESGA